MNRPKLPPRAHTTADAVADALRQTIRDGGYAPGAAIRQEEVAARYGVSRLPVRDALARLEAEGLLVIHPNRGAFVASPNPEEVREAFDLRVLLETDALRRAVPRFTAAALRGVEAVQRELDVETDRARWLQLDGDFHAALYAPSGRARTMELIERLRAVVNLYYHRTFAPNEYREHWGREHHAILRAVRAADADGACADLASHLGHTADLVIAHLMSQPGTA
jgi:DNA-binding GntR family transcriptional regulator